MFPHIPPNHPLLLLAALALLDGTDFRCSTGSSLLGPDGGIRVSGTVHFLVGEGGCWQLRAQNGARYELLPEQAPSSVLVDGAQVVIVVRVRTDIITACNVGNPVDVETVESIR
jgi:hypothetical protein